ncbi:helix-turn-helix protein [Alteromonas sp. 76-1]|uniref:helix-turn-helix domain-containing protein n=1 Tax=Alteromonas sp. 76-1 TaxID=2358187 RepID=UPI000FD15E43|nr:helix-turn-helix transcriptional regulator [Alteromonas sp. 76-1]VEL96968.1 helix-turn-helix protein [Alteromonas sp. 76-1]
MADSKALVNEIFKAIPPRKAISTIHDAGLSERSVYKWRRGQTCPSFDNLQAFANAVGLELSLTAKDES